MPEGFAFPVYHAFWVPPQAASSDYERRQGPAINFFGRLAPGVSRDAAQAELTTIGLRAAAAFPVGSKSGLAVRFGFVGIDFFDVFQIPILAGRRFGSGDRSVAKPESDE